jgi:hypothetical protein
VDRFRKNRTLTEHRSEEREGREPQALGVKLRNRDLQPVALLQRAVSRGAGRLILQRRANGAKSFEDSSFVGVVFVSDHHDEGGGMLARCVRFLVKG